MRTLRRLLLIPLLLVGLLVGADRVAVLVADRVVASRVQQAEGLQARPDVDITGFPFLTQLARRTYEEVVVTAPTVTVGRDGSRVRLRQVRVALSDVHTSSDLQSFTAGGADASATVPYAELSRLTGLRVRWGGQGRITAGTRVEVAGQTFDPTLTVTPRLLDGAVTLGGELAGAASRLPAPVAAAVQDALGVRVPLRGLPFGVRPTGVEATPTGLDVHLVGSTLSFP